MKVRQLCLAVALLSVLLLVPYFVAANDKVSQKAPDFNSQRLLDNSVFDQPYIKTFSGRVLVGLFLVLIPTLVAIRFARLSKTLKKSIEQNRKVTDALRESEALHRATLQASPDAIAVTDLEGRIRSVSPSTLNMFGFNDEEELIGRTMVDLLVPEESERATSNVTLMFQGINVGPAEYRVVRADGREFVLEVNAEFILNAGGEAFSMVFIGRDVTERRRAKTALEESNRMLESLSITDALTGLANRRRFDEVMAQEHARHIRSKAYFSLIIIDIDHFKAFNDSYGHVNGDSCLQQVAEVIFGSAVRAADLTARYGGEEFACILPETDLNGALAIAEKMRKGIMGLAIPHCDSKTADCVTASLGVITLKCTSEISAKSIVEHADRLLYKAKSGGRNLVEFDFLKDSIPDNETENIDCLVQLVWKDSFLSGNTHIDSQHQELFRRSNKLLDAIISGASLTEISLITDHLVDDFKCHFRDEEAILDFVNFPGLNSHKEDHNRLYREAVEFTLLLQETPPPIGEIFKFLVHEVVLQHMLGADREFFPYICNSVGTPLPKSGSQN
jgi:diguanylate cyclase (GGDEF)-like protein/PAS domain S-box-containing protein/hemerythrin-like metal-binding protein